LSAVGLQVSAVLENTALHNELLEHERVKRDLALARLGQLAAGVAHEINNPLSFVLNNTVIIERDVDALSRLIDLYRQGEPILSDARPELVQEIHDFAEEIDLPYTLTNLHALLKRSREGLKRITQIVQDLRSFARLNESEVDEVDLNPCLKATIGIAQGLAEKRGVTLKLELGTLPRVSCQPARINQAVFNILSNAIDASPEGGQVVIRSGTAGDVVEVHISDRGPGIDPAIRDKIFDPFFTTKPLGKGVGLGLSIAHGIISDHGGAIEAVSQQGQGAVFIVRLPSRSPVQSHST
jgi:two-component system, NtrC family, sensor kinase